MVTDKRMYRIIEGISVWFQPEWVLQKKDYRTSHGQRIPTWRTIYTSKSLESCEAKLDDLKRRQLARTENLLIPT